MPNLAEILKQNKSWAESVSSEKPDFFADLAKQQTPEYLWIGCADSRVPATQACGLQPGDLFVHRNIANLVSPQDINGLSVIDYAVNHLKVSNIIVCGHYGCGGVAGAMSQKDLGLINHWIQDISKTYTEHQSKLNETCSTEKQKLNLLCELNVKKQVATLATLPVIQGAWQRGQSLTLHGLIYDLESGILKDLETQISDKSKIPTTLQLELS